MLFAKEQLLWGHRPPFPHALSLNKEKNLRNGIQKYLVNSRRAFSHFPTNSLLCLAGPPQENGQGDSDPRGRLLPGRPPSGGPQPAGGGLCSGPVGYRRIASVVFVAEGRMCCEIHCRQWPGLYS